MPLANQDFPPTATLGPGLSPAIALRRALSQGYGLRDLRSDLVAGVIVGVIALPLSMAFGIAAGVPPQHGLYTAIIAGALIALLGGSRVQVSGPTAAFVVILAPISATHGLGGLVVATMMAGMMLVLMALARLGRLIQFVPHPVTTGFTAGIAVVIASLQLADFAGLALPRQPDNFFARLAVVYEAIPHLRVGDLVVGLLTMATLLVWPRVSHRVPAPIVALPIGALAAICLHAAQPEWSVATIADRYTYTIGDVTGHGIPGSLPVPAAPWTLPGPDGRPLEFSLDLVRSLLSSAFAIAVLGAIVSLLSAVVADGVTGGKHDPNAELFAQGVGNIVGPLFGCIAATGAVARTATGARSGARSPLAAVFHSIFVLLAMVLLAPTLGHLPMASLAALLLIVAWNMADAKHFFHLIRTGPSSDVVVLLTCFALTIIFDMTVSVAAGVVLAALLFMKRMADLSTVRLVGVSGAEHPATLPAGVLMYEIAGPLFFGAAQRAMSALKVTGDGVRVVLIDMRSVPVMDATGLVNLESALDRIRRLGAFVVLGGVQQQPLHTIGRAGWGSHHAWLTVTADFQHALQVARERAELPQTASPAAH